MSKTTEQESRANTAQTRATLPEERLATISGGSTYGGARATYLKYELNNTADPAIDSEDTNARAVAQFALTAATFKNNGSNY